MFNGDFYMLLYLPLWVFPSCFQYTRHKLIEAFTLIFHPQTNIIHMPCQYIFFLKKQTSQEKKSYYTFDIGRNSLLGNRKNSQMFNGDFYMPLYLPLWVFPSCFQYTRHKLTEAFTLIFHPQTNIIHMPCQYIFFLKKVDQLGKKILLYFCLFNSISFFSKTLLNNNSSSSPALISNRGGCVGVQYTLYNHKFFDLNMTLIRN